MSDLSATTVELMLAQPILLAIGDREMGVKAAYAFAKQKRAVGAALEDVEATRLTLCRRHAKKDDAGEPVLIDGTDARGEPVKTFDFADRPAFDADWKTLLAEAVPLPGCRAVNISELASASFTPDELFALGPLVVEDEPDSPAASK